MSKRNFKIFTPKVLLFVLVLLIAAGSSTVFVYYLVRAHRRTMRFQEALTQLEAGNVLFAKRLLNICINEDPNNELAFVKMAELLTKEGRWNNAAQLWRRAAVLNPLKAEYRQAEIDALLRGRLYNNLLSTLEQEAKDTKLSPQQNTYLAYANYKLDRVLIAEEIFLSISDRETLLSPMARLLEVVLNIKKNSDAVRLRQLVELAESEDPVVAFEALEHLARQFTLDKQPEQAENALTRARDLNPECGTPILGQFYFFNNNFDAAIPIFQEILDNGTNPTIALMLGEALATQNRLNEIRKLSEKYRVGNKTILQLGTYLDALYAFGRQDFATLSDNIKRIKGVYKTPVALLMSLHAAVYERDVNGIREVVDSIRVTEGADALLEQAQNIVMPLIKASFDGQNFVAAANLADLFQNPNKPDLFLTQVSLTGNFDQGLLRRRDIEAALQAFPDDPVVLHIAAELAMQNRQFGEALTHIERNLRNGNATDSIRLQYILALHNNGQTDRAISQYQELLKDNHDDRAMVYNYFAFCVSNNRKNELQALLADTRQRPEAEQRYLAPYIEAELALLNNDIAGMVAILKKAISEQELGTDKREDVELIYRVAYLLALVDEILPAIELYERIADVYPMPIMVQLNLAELYAGAGEYEKALELAQAAWQSNGSLQATQECLGLRLVETRHYARAVQLLGLPVDSKKATPRALDAWRIAMEALIKDAFVAKKYLDCLNLGRQLLRHFSDNQVALDHVAQCQAALGDAAP
ncbi:MAG: tetratricopeptide repeat protein [Lentisphaeria bacterium]